MATTNRPGGDPAAARQQLQAFADLITQTTAALRNVGTPGQLAAALDGVLAPWEAVDKDFAAVLKDLKGQAWSMKPDHLRAIREKLVQHLEANLGPVKQQLAQLGHGR